MWYGYICIGLEYILEADTRREETIQEHTILAFGKKARIRLGKKRIRLLSQGNFLLIFHTHTHTHTHNYHKRVYIYIYKVCVCTIHIFDMHTFFNFKKTIKIFLKLLKYLQRIFNDRKNTWYVSKKKKMKDTKWHMPSILKQKERGSEA